jgi:lipopolysaccharide/colanic/teichoic acid biosynthesis glycosyltransferase
MLTRLFDIVFSLIALFFLSPLLLSIIVVLSLTGEREIFFFQERVGINGKVFKIIKFATMLKNSPNIGTKTITTRNDPRVLPIGKFLRVSKLNELPQLLNILKGDMSIIGPRPLTYQNFLFYSENTQEIIKMVRPGLSGVGSIIFHKEDQMIANPDNSDQFYENFIAPFKGELEVWYVNNRSLYIYFLIIFMTIWVIIFSSNNIAWKFLRNLPKPPVELKKLLNSKETN